MRNSLFTIIITAIIIVISGCKQTSPKNHTLQIIENIIDLFPDSALALIQDVDTIELSNEFDCALYSLLKSKAEDKNNAPISDIYNLQKSVDYFETTDIAHYMMLANLYLGKAFLWEGDYTKSALNLAKAEELAYQLGDNFNSGMCNQMLQVVYQNTYDGQSELKHAKNAQKFYTLANATPHLRYSRYMVCQALSNNSMYDECIDSALVVLEDAKLHNDSVLIYLSLSILGSSYLVNNDYDQSITCISYIEKNMPNFMDIDDYTNLGLSYLYKGDNQQASYYEKIINNTDTVNWLSFKLAENKKDYGKALRILQSMTDNQEGVLKQLLSQNVSVSLDEMHKNQEINLNKDLQKTKLFMVLIIICATLSLIIALLIIINRSLRIKHLALEHNEVVYSLKSNISNLLSKIQKADETRIKSNHNLKMAFKTFDDLCQTYIECIDTQLQNTSKAQGRIYNKLTSHINSFQKDESLFKELVESVNSITDNLINKINDALPNLSKEDERLFVFIALGFSSSVIALFMGSDIKSIYNRKHRLKKRIKETTADYKEDLLAILK